MADQVFNYLVSYDAFSALPFSDKLLAFVKENGKLLAWSKPYDGLYFVKSHLPLVKISESFGSFFGVGTTHFIYAVHPQWLLGIAPPSVWNWLNMNTVPQLIDWGGAR